MFDALLNIEMAGFNFRQVQMITDLIFSCDSLAPTQNAAEQKKAVLSGAKTMLDNAVEELLDKAVADAFITFFERKKQLRSLQPME